MIITHLMMMNFILGTLPAEVDVRHPANIESYMATEPFPTIDTDLFQASPVGFTGDRSIVAAVRNIMALDHQHLEGPVGLYYETVNTLEATKWLRRDPDTYTYQSQTWNEANGSWGYVPGWSGVNVQGVLTTPVYNTLCLVEMHLNTSNQPGLAMRLGTRGLTELSRGVSHLGHPFEKVTWLGAVVYESGPLQIKLNVSHSKPLTTVRYVQLPS